MMSGLLLDGLRRVGRAEVLLVTAALALTAFYYGARADEIGVRASGGAWVSMTLPPHAPLAHFLGAALLLGAIPLFCACALLQVSPRELGLGVGRWREGLLWLAAGLPIAILAGRVAAGSEAMRAVYPLDRGLDGDPGAFLRSAALQFFYYGSWEILFRGVLLFGLRGPLGAAPANAVQTALSVAAHFGRPLDETFAAIPAGLLFGWVDLRVGSIWYVAILHWLVGVAVDWFIVS